MANEFQDEHGSYTLDDDDDLAAMLEAAHGDWELSRPMGAWAALKRSGRSERFLVARTAPELAAKIEQAEGTSA